MDDNASNAFLSTFARKYFSPDDDEKRLISEKYVELESILPGNEIFQSGSYRRRTSVTPVHDLDVIWILPTSLQDEFFKSYSQRDTSHPFLYDVKSPLRGLAKILQDSGVYRGIADIDESQSHSVSIKFKIGKLKDFSIDVVPAVRSGRKSQDYHTDILLVPEVQKMGRRKRQKFYESGSPVKWIETDPNGYIEESIRLNVNPYYRKAVKFVKVWRKSCNSSLTNFDIQSFHCELMMASLFKQDSNLTMYKALLFYFSRLESWLRSPMIKDRANPAQLVDDYLSSDVGGNQRTIIAQRAREMLGYLSSLRGIESEDDAISALRVVLIAKDPWGTDNLLQLPEVKITCSATPQRSAQRRNVGSGMRKGYNVSDYLLRYFNRTRGAVSGEELPPNYDLVFRPDFDLEQDDEVLWLIVNNGINPLMKARIGGWRGAEFEESDIGINSKKESTLYVGDHWIDVFIVRDGRCLATGRYYIIIREGVQTTNQ